MAANSIVKRHQARTYLPLILEFSADYRAANKKPPTAVEIAEKMRFADEKDLCRWTAETASRLANNPEADATLRNWSAGLLKGLQKSAPAEYFVVETSSGPSKADMVAAKYGTDEESVVEIFV